MNLAQQSILASASGLIFFLINLQQALESASTRGCVCPGDTLIYECTIMGGPGQATFWTGTAFNCTGNEIMLIHSRFLSAAGECNKRAIVARGVSVQNSLYTSQLNVTITPDIAGRTVMCFRDNSYNITLHLSTVIHTTGPFSPPNKLYTSNADLSRQEITFTWSPVAPDCPAIHYNILTSNCGSCPTTTNHSTVTCIDVPTNSSVCTFAVPTVVCGNITGNESDPINIIFDAMEPIKPTNNQYTTENLSMHFSDTNIEYIISTGLLTTALIVCIVVSMAAITITLKRNKVKTTAVFIQSNSAEGPEHDEPMYEDVTGSSPSVSVINTQANVAYSHTKTSTITT